MKKINLMFILPLILFSCGNEEKTVNDTSISETETVKVETEIKVGVDSVKTIIQKSNNTAVIETTTETNLVQTSVKTDTVITGAIKDADVVPVLVEKKDSVIKTIPEIKEPVDVVFNHQKWDILLRKNVSASGKVNYKGFLTDRNDFNIYINELKAEYSKLSSWSKNKQLAYWINVYNAFTVKLILENYPTSSIKTINGGKPWNKRFIQLGSKSYSLDEVENEIIRKRYNERRIHFALNCAAKSCPILMNQAFTEDNLNTKLSQMTRKFLKDNTKNVLTADKVQISKLFQWYEEDFTKTGNIIPFLRQYSNVEINDNASIEYLEYSWNLNE